MFVGVQKVDFAFAPALPLALFILQQDFGNVGGLDAMFRNAHISGSVVGQIRWKWSPKFHQWHLRELIQFPHP